MRAAWLRLLTATFLTVIAQPILAQPDPEPLRWPDTGQTRHGTLEAQHGPRIPTEELDKVDEATLEQVQRRRDRLRAKTSRAIPPLRQVVPVDPDRTPSSPPTEIGGSHAPTDFIFVRNTEPSAVVPAGFSATVNEPSVANARGKVFYTGNWYAASSADNGETFSFVNPFAGPFAPATGGFCCDQVTTYSEEVNALFYLQQFLGDSTSGVQRINVDQEADGTFDCFYDISPQTMGFPTENFSDFPDLAVADSWLYHSSNVFSTVSFGFSGAFVARYDLASLAACSSVPFDTFSDPTFFSFKLTRGATDTMYFADHITTSSLRIWRWPEGADDPTPFDRSVAAWTDVPRTCPGPDGADWCGFMDRRMSAAYVADGTVGFMWTPAQDATFPQPYTRIAQFSEATLALTGEPVIWSGSIAWGYASVAVNSNGDLGGTMTAGSTSLYPTCLAWIADDVNGDTLAPLENNVAYTGTSGPSPDRAGDYNSAHVNSSNKKLWAGACFAYDTPTEGTSRYLVFGREQDHLMFEDGFESGNTLAWD